MRLCFFVLAAVGLLVFGNTPVAALDLRVGTGAGCTHADIGAALNAIRTQTGTHTLRINKGVYAVPDGLVYTPTVSQTAVFLEGGYDSCTAGAPTGSASSDADRAVVNGAGGLERSVLDLSLYGRVGTFQIRRIVLTGGDATDVVLDNEFAASGGGLIVRGGASVLIGLGTTIRNNAAINGGGVALSGSSIYSNAVPLERADFYIAEGAEIRSNVATDRGGGIYCGGANTSTLATERHGSIVFSDGMIGYNQGNEGAAFYCLGSLEGGGGFQPRPLTGKVAWIIGNQRVALSSGVGCSGGFGTLDTVLPVQGDGFRHLGAATDSNGLVAITANVADNSPGLCLLGSRSLSDPNNAAPAGSNRFRLRNLYVSDQVGGGTLGLRTGDRLELIVEPSGDSVQCSFFSATPCVRFYSNQVDGVGPATDDGQLLIANGESLLQLRRAMVDDNRARTNLISADDGGNLILMASILDNNEVVARASLPSTSALFGARFDAIVDVRNSTIIMRSPLDMFFRLGWAPFGELTGTAWARASIFASTAASAPQNVGEVAPSTNFTREWCGFFQSTADFASHSVVVDPVSGVYQVHAPAAFALASDYAPTTLALRDACRTPTTFDRDFYGRSYDVNLEPSSPVHADIGAVEAQLVPDIFKNGFE